jgi:hypothetical protein
MSRLIANERISAPQKDSRVKPGYDDEFETFPSPVAKQWEKVPEGRMRPLHGQQKEALIPALS